MGVVTGAVGAGVGGLVGATATAALTGRASARSRHVAELRDLRDECRELGQTVASLVGRLDDLMDRINSEGRRK